VLSALVSTGSDQTALARLYPTNAFIAGTILAFTGAIIRILCFRELGRLFTFDFCIRKDHKLITTGPYGYVRHPSYSGSLMHLIGALMCHLSAGSWLTECGALRNPIVVVSGLFWLFIAASRTIYAVIRSKEEDEGLRKEFGKQWDAWAARVNYRVIPGFL
jgi:protein-S-isoprenylcysteine O-methyltransferase Ste14